MSRVESLRIKGQMVELPHYVAAAAVGISCDLTIV